MTDQQFEQEWVRDFPGEKVSFFDTILHSLRGGRLGAPDVSSLAFASVTDVVQAEFVDTNFYYRIDGIDPEKAKLNNDILAIQWGIGSRKVETYDNQVAVAKAKKIRYVSWWIPDPSESKSVKAQAVIFMSDPLVLEAPAFVDLESPRAGVRYANYLELKDAIEVIREASRFRPGCYSRVNIFEAIFGKSFPDWFEDVLQWIAQYLYVQNTTQYYTNYEDFLQAWGWSLPLAVTRSSLYDNVKFRKNVIAWQFTPKGKAIVYIAPEFLPNGDPAIKSCDLNVSPIGLTEFIFILFGEEPTEPDFDCEKEIEAINLKIEALTKRVDDLENNPGEPPPPPPPPEEPEFITVKVLNEDKKNCSVYLQDRFDKACEGEPEGYDGNPGKAWPETKKGTYLYGTTFKVYKKGWLCCKDDPNTPEVVTTLGEDYLCYIVFGGEWDGCLVPVKRLTIIS